MMVLDITFGVLVRPGHKQRGGVEAAWVFFFFFFFFFFFLGPHMGHTEVPRLGLELELQLLAYTTAAVTWDPSRICDLYHSLWQHRILNPLIEARD